MRARVYVTLRPGVLDPAGQAVCASLNALGYAEVRDVRIAKVFEVDLAPTGDADPRQRLDAMCRQLLANTVIEDFRVELDEAG